MPTQGIVLSLVDSVVDHLLVHSCLSYNAMSLSAMAIKANGLTPLIFLVDDLHCIPYSGQGKHVQGGILSLIMVTFLWLDHYGLYVICKEPYHTLQQGILVLPLAID